MNIFMVVILGKKSLDIESFIVYINLVVRKRLIQMTNYEVGDVVGFARFHTFGSILTHGFGTVTKINGHGHIFIKPQNGDEKRFDKYGNTYKDKYGPSLIGAARLTEILEQQQNDRNIRKISKELAELIVNKSVTNEMLDALEVKIAKLREMI